jgi:hypothetical protein
MTLSPQVFEDIFWHRVTLCLADLHKLKFDDAESEASQFRRNFPSAATFENLDMIYHASPFEIACDIAGNRLSFSEFKSQYELILKQTEVGFLQPKKPDSIPIQQSADRQIKEDAFEINFRVSPEKKELATAGSSSNRKSGKFPSKSDTKSARPKKAGKKTKAVPKSEKPEPKAKPKGAAKRGKSR